MQSRSALGSISMPNVGWDALAKWRDSRMGEAGDLWHRALIDPALLAVLGPSEVVASWTSAVETDT